MQNDFIENLLQKTDIVRLIQKYVPLTKKGNTYWGCCPFHHEKAPSFTVSEDKQLYHCFGCKEGGNAITFLKKIESIEAIEAMKILAEACNMQIPENKVKENKNFFEDEKKKKRLYALMRDAARHYHENLKNPKAGKVVEYMQKRGLSGNLSIKFGLGASLGWDEMVEYLTGLGYQKSEMKAAGIADQKADRYYDVFAERLIFPIINPYGEVVSFGGRSLNPDENFAKYRNGSQTLIFDKSQNLYGLNLLKKKKQAEGLERIIITEGYMDVIALHKAGFTEAIASMGTSLTTRQAKILKNFSARVYISYDGDGAGQKATLRGLDILMSAGLNVKVVELPEGLDPDDVIKTKGGEFYEDLLQKALPLTAFKIKTLKASYDLTKMDEKAKFAVDAVKVVKELDNPVEQEEYFQLISRYTGYGLDILKKQADMKVAEAQPFSVPSREAETTPEVKTGKTEKAEEFVLASLINRKNYVDYGEDVFPYLTEGFCADVYMACIEGLKCGDFSPAALYTYFEEEKQRLDKLVNFEFLGNNEEEYKKCLYTLKLGKLEKDSERLSKEFDTTKDLGALRQLDKVRETIKQMKSGGGQYD